MAGHRYLNSAGRCDLDGVGFTFQECSEAEKAGHVARKFRFGRSHGDEVAAVVEGAIPRRLVGQRRNADNGIISPASRSRQNNIDCQI